jgi:hypothetical protein
MIAVLIFFISPFLGWWPAAFLHHRPAREPSSPIRGSTRRFGRPAPGYACGLAGIWDQRGNRAPFNFYLLAILVAKYVLLGSGVVPRSLRPASRPSHPSLVVYVTMP